MGRNFSDEWQLSLAYLTETQAIAIYQAECFLFRHSSFSQGRRISLELCQEILREELEHEKKIMTWFHPGLLVRLYLFPNNFLGTLVGIALALLPSKLCWRLHVIAENQAAQTYERTAKALERPEPELLAFLQEAALHEKEHAGGFLHLLSPAPKEGKRSSADYDSPNE